MRKLLGTGILTWTRGERVSDRYGTVFLMPDGDSFTPPSGRVDLDRVEGKGKLVAEVVETRESTHIGDFFHGLFPETPKVGERIELGEGEVFFEDSDPVDNVGTKVGIKPHDDRDHWWLDAKALYRVHEQTVNLYFETGIGTHPPIDLSRTPEFAIEEARRKAQT